MGSSREQTFKQPLRLAEEDGIAIDLCTCGTWVLHIGAHSLRLRASTLTRLMQTMGLAVARHQELLMRSERQYESDDVMRFDAYRGEAK
jgi:hypothetical protein